MKKCRLVRDNCPDWLKEVGDPRKCTVAETGEVTHLLLEKLQEESEELSDPDARFDELADVIEVIISYGWHRFNITREEVFSLVEKKYRIRGGFERGYLLESRNPE